MPKETTHQIAFRGTEEYRNRLQDEARARRIKVQELIERALEVYLKGSAAAEVAAQRTAEQMSAPPGHKVIIAPDELVDLFEMMIKWHNRREKK